MIFSHNVILLRGMVVGAATSALIALSPGVHAVEWFDDFSDGSAEAPPVHWTPTPVFPGDYDASSGDYILRPTDDPGQPNGTDSEILLATVNGFFFTDISVRTRAVVGFSDQPILGDNADFDSDGLVDGNDFLVLQRHFIDFGFHEDGDADFNDFVDEDDQDIWRDQFGSSRFLRGGNVGVAARFNPQSGDGYIVVMDDGNQWNLLAVSQFGGMQVQINDQEGENVPPVDPDTGETINASEDLMIQLDVTGQGDDTLLEVWFWRPDEPMPEEPFFSRVDSFSGIAIDEGAAGVIYTEDEANSPGIYRFVQASDVHLGDASPISAVPEPPAIVGGLIVVLTACGYRIKRRLTSASRANASW